MMKGDSNEICTSIKTGDHNLGSLDYVAWYADKSFIATRRTATCCFFEQ
jgi:hypothetical protein